MDLQLERKRKLPTVIDQVYVLFCFKNRASLLSIDLKAVGQHSEIIKSDPKLNKMSKEYQETDENDGENLTLAFRE